MTLLLTVKWRLTKRRGCESRATREHNEHGWDVHAARDYSSWASWLDNLSAQICGVSSLEQYSARSSLSPRCDIPTICSTSSTLVIFKDMLLLFAFLCSFSSSEDTALVKFGGLLVKYLLLFWISWIFMFLCFVWMFGGVYVFLILNNVVYGFMFLRDVRDCGCSCMSVLCLIECLWI